MPSTTRFAPLLLTLLLAACGIGRSPEEARKANAALADAALSTGTPEVALRLSDATLAKDPADADALTRRGQALTELGQLGEARASLQKAVTIAPRNARALLALGRVQLPVDPAGAESDFASALQQDSQNAAAMNDLGIARDLLGRHTAAEAAYRGAIAAQPNMAAAHVNLALSLAMTGRGGEAIRLVQPLADAPEASRKIKEDYAAVLAMAGERDAASRILSATLGEDQVAAALDALTSARPAAAPAGLAMLPRATDDTTPAPTPLPAPSATPIRLQADTGTTPVAPGQQPVVQLAALDSETAAHDEWAALAKRFPALLGGRQPIFGQTERNGHTFWRVRTTGFQDVNQAQTFCARLRSAGAGCTVFNS
ncbi:MAG TPA: tetratricopeptide repeat protein [Rhodopila sp.]|jgi:Flp pilus assembly protein TadD|nr:tetratricopeptide repeat protein [Rhodopila sp.]